jgi:periplasmic copper chaperone A
MLATTGAVLAGALTGCGGPDAAATQSPATEGSRVLVEDAWVRATSGTKDTTMTAAFMTLTNPGDADVTLTSAVSPVAGKVELHEMAKSGGAMVMREKPGGITVKAGSHQHLTPGGLHVMLMALGQELKAGDEVTVTLTFSDGSKQLTVPVKKFTEEEEHYHTHSPQPGQ